MPLISIIIPIYNTCEHLNKCLNSVFNQTLKDIEILLIDNGSTDGSGELAKQWAQKDPRMRYHKQLNKGVGYARNKGIQIALSPYLMFVDSDDVIDLNMAKKLYEKAEQYDSDITFCGIEWCGKTSRRRNNFICDIKTYSNLERNPDLLHAMTTSVCDKLIKKALFIENSFFFPEEYRFEDMAVMPKLTLKAKRISQVSQYLYFYYYEREGNFSNQLNKKHHINSSLHAFNEVVSYYKEHNVFEKYKLFLMILFQQHIKIWVQWNTHLYYEAYQGTFNLPCVKSLNVGIWGSYNLRATLQNIFIDSKQIKYHFSNSSIISIMSEEVSYEVNLTRQDNSFRELCLQYELNKYFIRNIGDIRNNLDFLCIDFLEERFSNIKVDHNTYLTFSDAFKYSPLSEVLPLEQIGGGSDNKEIWERYCKKFIRFLKNNFKSKQIILVENYMCESYGYYHDINDYPESEQIKHINECLAFFYEYFKSHYSGINIVSNLPANLQYTSGGHRYGKFPYHANEIMYMNAALKIADILKEIEEDI